jgi:hypothetical protein
VVLAVATGKVATLTGGDEVGRVVAATLGLGLHVVDVGAGRAAGDEAAWVDVASAVPAGPAVSLEDGGTDALPGPAVC